MKIAFPPVTYDPRRWFKPLQTVFRMWNAALRELDDEVKHAGVRRVIHRLWFHRFANHPRLFELTYEVRDEPRELFEIVKVLSPSRVELKPVSGAEAAVSK